MYNLYQNWGGNDSVNSNFPFRGGSPIRYGSAPNTTNVTGRRIQTLTCPSDQSNNPIGAITNCNYAVCGGNGGTYRAAGPTPRPAGYSVMPGMFDGNSSHYGTTISGGSVTFNTNKIKLTDATDGLTNSVMVGEVRQGQGRDLRGFIWWGDATAMSTYYPPNASNPDLIYSTTYCNNQPTQGMPCVGGSGALFSSRSKHTGGVNACMGDGGVRFFSNSISPLVWLWMGPINDGKVVSVP
jgi:hypothetical protein